MPSFSKKPADNAGPKPIAGFVVQYTGVGPVTVFAVNFIAVIPMSLMIGYASDSLIMQVGDIVGALVNTTFRYGSKALLLTSNKCSE
jgi:hypothetical protein